MRRVGALLYLVAYAAAWPPNTLHNDNCALGYELFSNTTGTMSSTGAAITTVPWTNLISSTAPTVVYSSEVVTLTFDSSLIVDANRWYALMVDGGSFDATYSHSCGQLGHQVGYGQGRTQSFDSSRRRIAGR